MRGEGVNIVGGKCDLWGASIKVGSLQEMEELTLLEVNVTYGELVLKLDLCKR